MENGETRVLVVYNKNSKFLDYRPLKNLGFSVSEVPNDFPNIRQLIISNKINVVISEMYLECNDSLILLQDIGDIMDQLVFCVVTTCVCDKMFAYLMKNGADYCLINPSVDKTLFRIINFLIEDKLINGTQQSKEERRLNNKIKFEISNALSTLGISPNLTGYRYVRDAIFAVIKNPFVMDHMIKDLYSDIASRYKTNVSCVEKAIRTAVTRACDRGEVEALQIYLGYIVDASKDKPTNSQFIASVADKLSLKIEGSEIG